jgi:capsular exopolysaccharide synthesis family protein
VVTAAYPYSRAASAFRILCVGTSRWISGAGVPGAKTILVTSSEARDGKTTVAANLAVAHAEAGDRVLVVSCDLRRPSIHRVFGVPEEPGLVDLLQSMNSDLGSESAFDMAPFLEPCSVVRVAVLPSGITPQQPGELLGSVTMHRLLGRLRRVTDVIILDCAPLVVASDVVPLLPQVDGVVLVARAGKTRRDVGANAAALLERMGAKQVGVVLSDAREFSLPLAKRRMYRPTRKMRNAARKRLPTEVEQPWIREPLVQEPTVNVLVIPEFEVGVPEIAAPVESTESSVTPEPTAHRQGHVQVPDAAPSNGGRSPSAVDDLQRQLADIRARLEGLQLELPDPSGGLQHGSRASLG